MRFPHFLLPFLFFPFLSPIKCFKKKMYIYIKHTYFKLSKALFNEHHVDLIYEAHIHSYERTYPMVNGNATQFNYDSPTAPVYIIQVNEERLLSPV
jgi:hypothetical protein